MTNTQQNLPARATSDSLRPARAAVLSEHNQVMSQWLELQLRQVQANERFLEAHERIALACLAGSEGPSSLPTVGQGRPRLAPPEAPIPPDDVVPAAPPRPPLPPAPTRAPRPAVRALAPRRVQPAAPQPAAPQPAAPPAPSGSPAGQNGDGAPVGVALAVRPQAPPSRPSTDGAPGPAAGQAVAAPTAVPLEPPPTDEFRRDLLQAVAERTGYPPEMLKPDALLEADLGIDSIKTVEIFSSLTKYHQFMPGSGGVDEEVLSEFSKLKTLDDIVAMYDRGRQHLGRPTSQAEASAPAAAAASTAALSPVAASAAEAARVDAAPSGATPAPVAAANEPPLARLEVAAVAAPAEDSEKKNSLAATSS